MTHHRGVRMWSLTQMKLVSYTIWGSTSSWMRWSLEVPCNWTILF